ncbi:integrase domain-containing protein [Vibrio alfacsensis]|uniref:integrase domain-containing protein n=1 Tax=Vibrio alfacsensis TaxID=1074311 RepID=UPI0040698C03
MAISVKPLTPTQVDKVKPKEKEFILSDGYGLRLRVKPNGTKTWLFHYKKPSTSKRTNLKIGSYPAITLADARKKREQFLSDLAAGNDPQDVIQAKINANELAAQHSLFATAEQWMQIKKATVSADYALDAWRSLEIHVFPKLGNKPIGDITPRDVIDTLKPIEAKGNFETIRRICQRLNEIMVFATNTGIIDFNTLANIKAAFIAPKKQHMATLPPERVGELVERIYNASITVTTRNLLLWQLHTMTRPSEAAGTQWSEIDFDNSLWIIPAERMKKRIEHRVPLTAQTLKILKRMQPVSGHHQYVFPSDRDNTKHTHPQTANMALKRMGFGGQLVAHGLRALASTTLNDKGFAPDLIETALAHLDKNEVRRAYNRSEYIERRREMMAWWSEQISTAVFEEVK